MRKLKLFLLAAASIVLTANGGDDLEYARSSRESMMKFLERMDVQIGADLERGRIVAIGTSGFHMKGGKSDGEWEVNETYDFPDDDNDDFETKRFKAVWKAYANGLADIATLVKTSMDNTETKDKDGKVVSMTTAKVPSLSLNGVVTIEMCESLTNDGEYEVTVVVCQSKEREKMYSRGLASGDTRPGKYTLAELVEQKSKSGSGMICPQSYCDNEGLWWRIAGVPVDLSAGRNSKKVALLSEKAKRYAYEAAIRTIWVDVSASMSLMSTLSVSAGGESVRKEKISRKVCIKPLRDILPSDPFRVKWLELDKVNPITGKPIRLIVCAIRDDAGARDAERKFFAERLIKERQEAYERGRRDAERLMPKKESD